MKKKHIFKGTRIIAGLFVFCMLLFYFPVISHAESTTESTTESITEAEKKFCELYLKMLETGDTSVQDISDLNLLYETCRKLAEQVKYNEGYMAYQSYLDYPLMNLDEVSGSGYDTYLRKFSLPNTDEGFVERYKKVQSIVAEVQKNLDDKMTDLDKLMWINEYVVENIYYLNTEQCSAHLGGPTLVNGYGVCEGYAGAMAIFLKEENIPCKIVNGGAHEWLAVQIDGQWYHVDPTWNDTYKAGGVHYFLLRNDNEFLNTLSRKHDTWAQTTNSIEEAAGTISTSTKYESWYVHDVKTKMHYYDGYWYYVSNNLVKKNNIQGTAESVVYQGTLQPTITGIENGVLKFTVNSEEKTVVLKTETSSDEKQDDSEDQKKPDETTGEDENQDTTTDEDKDKNQDTATDEDKDKNQDTVKDEDKDQGTTKDQDKGQSSNPSKPNATDSNVSKTKKPGRPVIRSVTNKKKRKIKIVLKKKVAGADGYEVKICKNKKFKKAVRTVRFTGTSKTISKFSKNKTYYVKVRAYKKNSKGNRIYGPYSSVKRVKIKK